MGVKNKKYYHKVEKKDRNKIKEILKIKKI